jgi:hypothetical protein
MNIEDFDLPEEFAEQPMIESVCGYLYGYRYPTTRIPVAVQMETTSMTICTDSETGAEVILRRLV